MDEADLKQAKIDNVKTNESESEKEDKTSKNDTINTPAVIQTKEEYFDALRAWLQQVQLQQMAYTAYTTYFPYYLSSNLPPNNIVIPPMPFLSPQYPTPFAAATPFNQQIGNFPQAANNNVANPLFVNNIFQQNRTNYMDNVRQNMQIIYQNGGYEYVIAPIWKRFLAETIDVIILFIFKLMVVFVLMDVFNIQIVNLDFENLKTSFEEDYLDFLTFSSDLLLVEILTKVMVCIYEALWTAHGQSVIGGATPGKMIMSIRILYVEAVVLTGQINAEPNFNASTPLRALMYPASNPGFRRALYRAIAKNMLMTLMFPMCFVLLFFRNNRTGYDVMTKTIVVEENPVPIRRQL